MLVGMEVTLTHRHQGSVGLGLPLDLHTAVLLQPQLLLGMQP